MLAEESRCGGGRIKIHVEGCTITTDGGVTLLRSVAEKLSTIAHRYRNDNIDGADAFSFALDAVDRAIGEAIAQHESQMNTSIPSGMKRPLKTF
jgi:hypothetical protein